MPDPVLCDGNNIIQNDLERYRILESRLVRAHIREYACTCVCAHTLNWANRTESAQGHGQEIHVKPRAQGQRVT